MNLGSDKSKIFNKNLHKLAFVELPESLLTKITSSLDYEINLLVWRKVVTSLQDMYVLERLV